MKTPGPRGEGELNFLSSKAESKKSVPKEFIFYHTMIHQEAEHGAILDFFAPKSEATQQINKTIDSATDEIKEVQNIVKTCDPKILEELKKHFSIGSENAEGLSVIGTWILDSKKKKLIIQFLENTGIFDAYPLLKKNAMMSSDVGLRKVRDDFNFILNSDDQEQVNFDQLKDLAHKRSESYFLAKEHEGYNWGGFISFDIRKLIQVGFKVYEANAEIADCMAVSFHNFRTVNDYLESIKRINNPAQDCVKYNKKYIPNPDSQPFNEGSYRYDPYCPEYLVERPTVDELSEYISSHQEEVKKTIMQYTLDEKGNLRRTKKSKDSKELKLDALKLSDKDDYRMIVNILFNQAVHDIQKT